MTAIVRNGQLELPKPIDLPDGTEVEIRLPDLEGSDGSDAEEGPMTSEEIARTLAAMDKIEPLEMSDEERAALAADRQARKEWEKAHFEEHAEKLRRIWLT
jgi:predicted DNA-binding antitoxin AbrB/MazE fold protein